MQTVKRDGAVILLIVVALAFQAHGKPGRKAHNMMDPKRYFEGVQLRLAEAIDKDSKQAIAQAITSGAKVDEAGKEGVTPLMYALVVKKKNSVAELLARSADPNKRAQNGENAVTLSGRLAISDLDYLKIVLRNGGDPNTVEKDDDPILILFIAQGNVDAIRVLAGAKANLDVLDRTKTPAIVHAAYSGNWDCVWALIAAGANWRVTHGSVSLAWLAHTSSWKPDSPMYPWLVKTIEFLKSQGVSFPPPSPQQMKAAQQPRQ